MQQMTSVDSKRNEGGNMGTGFPMLALLAGTAASMASIAEDMVPGLWEIAMEMRVSARRLGGC